jgi:hypothetical protein
VTLYAGELLLEMRKAAVSDLQEDQPEDRDGVLRCLQVRVGPELIRRLPEAGT